MTSMRLLFETWWLIPSSERPFYLLFSKFHKSLTRKHPECAKAQPSFRPLILSGVPLVLRIDKLAKKGCLRVSTALVRSVLLRPGLTFSQAPTMFFHIEH